MTSGSTALATAIKVDRAFVLEKLSNFVDFQIWPLTATLDPEGWLQNFYGDEEEHALHLLNSFVFYCEQMTDQLFQAAFHHLSALERMPSDDFASSAAAWDKFNQRLILTYITGENPNPTDSGLLFSRKARQVLRVGDQQILDPVNALSMARKEPDRPIVFVDDFVGSGNQFLTTWRRKYPLQSGTYTFASHVKDNPNTKFYYTPAIVTSFGLNNIQTHASRVHVSAGNVLPDENNALHPNSNVWPTLLAQSGPQFVEAVSHRAGIPDMSGNVGDWRGFNRLGLCLAFSHSTPDATLPIFYWEHNGWTPLVRRR